MESLAYKLYKQRTKVSLHGGHRDNLLKQPSEGHVMFALCADFLTPQCIGLRHGLSDIFRKCHSATCSF